MTVRVQAVDGYVTNLQTRLPFSFGSVTLDRFPHVFIETTLEVDGSVQTGIAADNVVPKWFVKRADKSIAEDVEASIEVIDVSCRLGQACQASTPYELWRTIYQRVASWADDTRHPPLLWGFGVSLVERAIIDAYCRATGETFPEAVRNNSLGIDLGAIYPELAGRAPAQFLPGQSLDTVAIRHTVGHSDSLSDADITASQRLDDGLPESLEEYIQTDGVRFFKVKLTGNVQADTRRLQEIHNVVERSGLEKYAYTVDANEQYDEVASLRELWETVQADPALDGVVETLRFIEQPFPRDTAFSHDTAAALQEWEDRPPIIIDESEGEMDSLGTALDCGYDGTSHKNCKGVFSGIANACLLQYRQRHDPERNYVLSGEDLTTIGPVSLLQDLATAATLGIDHIERNGHHYFRGLSMFPEACRDRVLTHHDDLYRTLADGVPSLDIEDGDICLTSVIEAPFGGETDVDLTMFEPIRDWSVESLGLSPTQQ